MPIRVDEKLSWGGRRSFSFFTDAHTDPDSADERHGVEASYLRESVPTAVLVVFLLIALFLAHPSSGS